MSSKIDSVSRFSLRRFVADTFEGADMRHFDLCGMDEVGRGAFAGPLTAAAVVLPPQFRHPLLRDSKQLTPAQREAVEPVIREVARACAVVEISAADINLRGMGWANVEVFRRLTDMVVADGYCCDGNLRIAASRPVHCLPKGDSLVPAIAAASIIAKVHRDAVMCHLHNAVPDYGWARNKGYGVPEHREAIRRIGAHAEHRRAFIASTLQGEFDLRVEAQANLHTQIGCMVASA